MTIITKEKYRLQTKQGGLIVGLVAEECPACNGSGKLMNTELRPGKNMVCGICKGHKVVWVQCDLKEAEDGVRRQEEQAARLTTSGQKGER